MDLLGFVLIALACIGIAAVVVGVILLQTNDGSIERIRLFDPVPDVPGANPTHRPVTSREVLKPHTDREYTGRVGRELSNVKTDAALREDRIRRFVKDQRRVS